MGEEGRSRARASRLRRSYPVGAPERRTLSVPSRTRTRPKHSHGPIEGGDFNILKNPFVLLGLPPTAKPTAIKEAYEDAIEDGVDDADVLMRAQQTLLTPRLRIEAEVGGFSDVDPGLAAQIVSDIRSGMPIGEIEERLRNSTRCPDRTSSRTTVRRGRWTWTTFAD